MMERQRQSTQKRALEKICSKPWDSWHPEAVKAYFAYTDKGQKLDVSDEAISDFNELLFCHRYHPHDVERWKEDFRNRTLFLEDFIFSPGTDTWVEHAWQVYESVMDFVPKQYIVWRRDGYKCTGCGKGRLEVETFHLWPPAISSLLHRPLPYEDYLSTLCEDCFQERVRGIESIGAFTSEIKEGAIDVQEDYIPEFPQTP